MTIDALILAVVTAIVVATIVVECRADRAYRARRARRARVRDEELVASCPLGISVEEWIRSRRVIARELGLDAELLDPSESIADATRFHTVTWLARVDFDDVLVDRRLVVSRERGAQLRTVGDLMALMVRNGAAPPRARSARDDQWAGVS